MHVERVVERYIGNTQSVSIPFFFFLQSSLYPIKIFAKFFYLLVIIMHDEYQRSHSGICANLMLYSYVHVHAGI